MLCNLLIYQVCCLLSLLSPSLVISVWSFMCVFSIPSNSPGTFSVIVCQRTEWPVSKAPQSRLHLLAILTMLWPQGMACAVPLLILPALGKPSLLPMENPHFHRDASGSRCTLSDLPPCFPSPSCSGKPPVCILGTERQKQCAPTPSLGSHSDPRVLFTHCPAHTPPWPSPAPIPSSFSPALPCSLCLTLTHTASRKPSLIHPNQLGFFHSLPTLSHSDPELIP